MNSLNINIRGKIYQLKFGLKSLIELSKISNLNVGEHFDTILHYGLATCQPQIELFHLSTEERNDLLSSLNKVFSIDKIPSNQTIEDWYKKGIGEIGLSLTDFYCLTPYELDLAYEGYLRRMELQANLIQLAITKTQNGNTKPIKIIPDKGYSLGSLKERQQVFDKLHLKEEANELR